MATTYKYQQNLYDGSSAGYVKYNITPDFGTVLSTVPDESWSPCETVTITGKFYCGNAKRYGLAAELRLVSSTSGFGWELGRIVKTVSKGSSATFSIECEITQQMMEYLNPTERGFSAYLTFFMTDQGDFNSGENTVANENQKLSLLQYRLPPEINSATLSDATGALEHFGGAVHGKSDLTAALSVTLDPLDASAELSAVSLHIYSADTGEILKTVASSWFDSTSAYFGIAELPVGTYSVGISAYDNKTPENGFFNLDALTIFPYASPTLKTYSDADLAERYEVQQTDTGEETTAQSDSGVYLWANFAAKVCSINGANAWKITRSYGDYGDTPANAAVVYSGTDGETLEFRQDQTVFPRSIEFAANKRYTVRITLDDFFESAVLEYTVEKAGGYFNIEKGGVAVGMRTNGTENKPMFESAYPFYPYGGIEKCAGVVKEIPLELDASGKFALYTDASPLCLRVYGNLVQLIGEVKPTASISGGTTEYPIAEIPAEYAPKYTVVKLCQGSGEKIWLMRVYADDGTDNARKIVFGRYRNGDAYTSAATTVWLPFEAMWITEGTENT